MYITRIPNRNSPPAILLRESYREEGKVKTRTLSNLSHLPSRAIGLIARSLKGEKFISVIDGFEKVRSWHHGHVDAVLRAMKRLDFDRLICSRRCKERDLALAMVVGRILEPDNEQNSKLANTRWWEITTLPAMLDVQGVDELDLYASMDWLLDRQEAIEKKLAGRHLTAGGLVLWDLTSSYFEGLTCPLASLGHNRDGKKGKLQVNYGIITDNRGCPVAVEVFEGNTLDHETVKSQTKKIRDQFGIKTMVLVGDRGMITQKLIDNELRPLEGVDWITALKSGAINKILAKYNLFQHISVIMGQDGLDVRIEDKAAAATAALQHVCQLIDTVRALVEYGKYGGKANIGVRVGKIINKYNVAKHFILDIRDDGFDYRIDQNKVDAESALDGIYVIRTSLPDDKMSAEDTVRSYKSLSQVERAFRSIKTVDLKVRPIRHHLERRVRAHILLCMLAYYVEWHMREAWGSLLFCDEDQEKKKNRDPIAPAERSVEAEKKVFSKRLEDGSQVNSFQTLLKSLSQIVRNECRVRSIDGDAPTFEIVTTPSSKQQQAYDLLNTITV